MINFDDILNQFKEEYKNVIEQSGHNSSGVLANSMTFETALNSKGYIITITLPEYAIYMENGTKPHFPPIEAIKQWIEIKPVLPRPLPNGKLPTTKQLAYLVARKISKVGTQPTNMIKDTMNQFDLVGKLYNRLAEEINREVQGLSMTATITSN